MNKRLSRAIKLLSLIFALAVFQFLGNKVLAFSNPPSNPAGGAGSIYIEASTPANTFYLKSNGNIGIGTTNPGAKLEVNGTAYVPQMFINRISGAGRGISWYSPTYTSWTDYMCAAGQTGCGPTGNITAPTGSLVTTWGKRSFIENISGYGWTFESGTSTGQPAVVAEIRSSDGSANFNGTVTANAFTGPLSGSISSANISAGSFGANTGGGNYSFPANLGVGTASPAGRLHVMAVTSGFPATSGTTQTGLVQRLQNSDSNLVADFGTNGASGMWIQSTNATGLSNTYPILLNPNGGNVGIGTTSPGAKLEVAGSTLTNRDNVAFYRNLVHYGTTTPTITGTLKVSFPKLWSATMMKMKIEGYNYNGGSRGTSWSVVVSGYNYSTGQAWYNYSAEISGAAPFNSVRLASDGTKNVVLLGTTTSIWNYPQIAVTEFMGGYSSYTGWDSGWAISFITDETGITGAVSPNIDFFRNSSGNIGIKTVTPTAELEVNGTVKATAFSGPLTGTNSAANVSSGNFGANTGGGDYSFPAALSTQGSARVFAGVTFNTAIGSADSRTLGLNGVGASSMWWNGSGTPQFAIDSSSGGGASFWQNNGGWNRVMDITSGNNVGIGNTAPAYKLDVTGDIHATGWLRTDGSQGWYSQTYGGGWFMQDSTWIRTYNAKNIWTSTGLIGGDGGLTIGYGGGAPPVNGAIIKGNIGIGTSSPLTKEHIEGSQIAAFTGATRGTLTISGPYTAGNYEAIDFLYTTGSNPTARIAAYHDGNGSRLVFGTSNSYATGITNAAMTIDQVANVTFSGNVNTCHLVAYSGGTTACPAGYYTWSGTALASGYMLCCKVDNPI